MSGWRSAASSPRIAGRLVTAFLAASSTATSIPASPPTSRRSSTTSPAAARLAGRAARLLGRLLQPPSAQTKDLKITDVIDALDAGSRPAFLPRARGRHRSARLPVLRQRPARAEARPVRRLHRLLELSGLPVHAQARHRMAARAQRHAEGRHARAGPASRHRRGDHRAPRPLRALRAAGRARPANDKKAKPQARLAAARHGGRDDHAGAGAGAALPAPPGRHPSRDAGSRSRPASAASAPM